MQVIGLHTDSAMAAVARPSVFLPGVEAVGGCRWHNPYWTNALCAVPDTRLPRNPSTLSDIDTNCVDIWIRVQRRSSLLPLYSSTTCVSNLALVAGRHGSCIIQPYESPGIR